MSSGLVRTQDVKTNTTFADEAGIQLVALKSLDVVSSRWHSYICLSFVTTTFIHLRWSSCTQGFNKGWTCSRHRRCIVEVRLAVAYFGYHATHEFDRLITVVVRSEILSRFKSAEN